jgi:2-polyprenyl-3-methyl-5-hydroxy-6-metoxy-1,4-benzoquinol methylase
MNSGASSLLIRAIARISSVDPKLGVRLSAYANGGDAMFHTRAQDFFHRYKKFIEAQGRSFDFGVDSFLRLQRSVEEQRVQFLRSGKYQNSSFEEVNRSVYSNPEVMQYHMHGLVFAQFLWPDQYRRFQFFSDTLPSYRNIGTYLEIGGGHALYVTEAARVLPGAAIDLVDISPTSLEMAKAIAGESRIRYHLTDIFDFPDQGAFDFITIGEVIEHVERPSELLTKLRSLLKPGGTVYITTPANAPMLDHIYLFRNAEEIRQMLTASGFRIEQETKEYAVKINDALAEKMRLPLMYAAFVTPV